MPKHSLRYRSSDHYTAASDVMVEDGFEPNDPLFGNQWHINSAYDINVQGVWDDYTGDGVVIGFFDTGIQFNHPDINDNYNASLDYDSESNTGNGAPRNSGDNHGTVTAGVAAAEGDNGTGVTGVAFGAEVSATRTVFGSFSHDDEIEELFALADQFDVYNNSWGFNGYFTDNFDTWMADTADEIEDAVMHGRGGLGTNIVFSSGNGRVSGDNANYHNLKNTPHTITVGATDKDGKYASFSTPGDSLLVSAPGVSILSTDRTGSDGYVDGDYVSVGGTSFSAPIVSGVIALMLEANPDLGYRDVQKILAASARNSDPGDDDWIENGSEHWNGGGMHFNTNYGFGLVDAHAAVRLAETWNMQSVYGNHALVDGGVSVVNSTIPNNSSSGVVRSKVLDSDLMIDRVEVDLTIDHNRIGDLKVTLTSPDGTVSTLINRPGINPDSPSGPWECR